MALAVVLAGGQKEGLIRGEALPVNEALIPIGSKLMVEYVVEALEHSSHIDRIVIAGPLEQLENIFGRMAAPITLVRCGDTSVESFRRAFQAAGPVREHILVVTADLPLLTTPAVDDFISTCLQLEGDLFYPIVSKQSNENKYPGIKRTYVNLREGIFTGGNLIFLKPEIVEKCLPIAEQLVRLRKKPLRLATYIGWGVLFRYIFGNLSLQDAEKEVSKKMGVQGVGIISSFPEIGIDVDKQSDLEIVKKLLCS